MFKLFLQKSSNFGTISLKIFKCLNIRIKIPQHGSEKLRLLGMQDPKLPEAIKFVIHVIPNGSNPCQKVNIDSPILIIVQNHLLVIENAQRFIHYFCFLQIAYSFEGKRFTISEMIKVMISLRNKRTLFFKNQVLSVNENWAHIFIFRN